MLSLLREKQSASQIEILDGLKSLRFYPDPMSRAFQKLPPIVQEEARIYWEKEQDRVDRLMQEYEEGEW